MVAGRLGYLLLDSTELGNSVTKRSLQLIDGLTLIVRPRVGRDERIHVVCQRVNLRL